MKILNIPVNFYQPAGKETPHLVAYLQEESAELLISKKREAVIVCPGGAYRMRSDREAEVVALSFMAEGKQAFVLNYSVAPAAFPCALTELAAAVALVRSHAEEWNVDRDRIYVCGFSAGGHLAASLGVFWQESFLRELLKDSFGADNGLWKPNGLILCYPVITMGSFTHEESRELLMGGQVTEEMIEKLSLENRVTKDVPAVFLWHTVEDGSVPVENTLRFAMALQRCKIPYEMHIFQKGAHGLGLCSEVSAGDASQIMPDNACWFDLAVRWMRKQN